MKPFLGITVIVILLAQPAFGMPIGGTNVTAGDLLNACVDRLRGQPVDFNSAHQKRWKGGSRNFTCWNDPQLCNQSGLGSQNEPVLAACAVGDYGWIAALAVKENKMAFSAGKSAARVSTSIPWSPPRWPHCTWHGKPTIRWPSIG